MSGATGDAAAGGEQHASGGAPEASGVVAYAPDLMDSTRVRGAVAGVTFVRDVAGLRDAALGAALVLVDLGRTGALDAVAPAARAGIRVVGFAAHVDEAVMDSARAVGVEALARSVFFRRLAALVADHAG